MQDLFGSVRRSLVFRTASGGDDGGFGGLVDKIGSSIRKSRVGLFSKLPAPPTRKEEVHSIRWRKGELIGCGAFGRVYMGMNLDSGELLAVKQVLIATNSASKEKTQAHIRELEEEVKLLKNLSHPNIVRYLGTAREDDSLNILLEFVPGGSISSLLGKFGSFPESVIRMYTKQILMGLEYLHNNGIMHRDIKGANILVDNKGCIKLADFGASKKVVELATINGAKSMKGTPYWMAPEVILQTGHNFSADIWSVGCTVIEMATGKPPWSQQYQEVAALFHIGTTKSHPPIPEHLTDEAKDFLLKCLQKEPYLRPSASDLLKHPFITGEYYEPHLLSRTSTVGSSGNLIVLGVDTMKSFNPMIRSSCSGLKDVCDMNSVRCSTVYPEKFAGSGPYWGISNADDDMCQIDDSDDLVAGASVNFNSALLPDNLNKSFNPMCEPADDWPCKLDRSLELDKSGGNVSSIHPIDPPIEIPGVLAKGENDFTFTCEPLATEDDDLLTESKIREFLDEKALELKKLQSPLFEEFFNTMNATGRSSTIGILGGETAANRLNLPPKSRSPNQVSGRRFSAFVGSTRTTSSRAGSHMRGMLNPSDMHDRALQEIQPQLSESKDLDAYPEPISPSKSFLDIQQKWKDELDEELRRKREMMYQASGGKSSPNGRIINRQRERLRFVVPGK